MNVLFVCSGNVKKFGISPIILNQANSLKDIGINIQIFAIEGKGFLKYLINRNRLKKFIRNNQIDIIHAHYSFSGFLASISTSKLPVVVSLMGSDTKVSFIRKLIIIFFNRFLWSVTIVKSRKMIENIYLKNVEIIPNGVNFDNFKIIDKEHARRQISIDLKKKIVVFIADPSRKEKNFELARKAINLVNLKIDCQLLIVFGENGVDHDKIPIYLNAADALILTSFYEGSPNVIKEAMACNCPIVSTEVGDVRSIIKNTKGCFITSYDPVDISDKLLKAINFGRTNGRENISELKSSVIAKSVLSIYKDLNQV
jgi:glycosyltransferase involved in cell wall biosynthesis